MGTWDTGPFDNDSAAEAVAALANGTFRMDKFRFNCAQHPLNAEEAELIIALAAIINGHVPDGCPETVLDFPFSADDRRWIRRNAGEALKPSGSELYALWQETGELDEWLAAARRFAS